MQRIPARQCTPQANRPALLITLLLLLSCSLPAQARCEKTLRWNDDPPFSMELADGSIVGIYVEVNQAVLERLGCRPIMRKLPWARALEELKLGRLDVLPGAFRRPEREEYAHFSGKVLPPSRNILFASQQAIDSWPIRRLTDLADLPFRLGAQINVQYGPDYQQLMSNADYADRVFMVNSRPSLWNMIEKDRIDGAIADEHTGAWEISQLGLSRLIKATDVVVSTEAAEVAFSKRTNDQDFVNAYAAAIRDLVSDGSYQRIVARYLSP
ncbi:MAG: transporter substrate-binding domain-containing protein [Pseudomonadaceae bacterium]